MADGSTDATDLHDLDLPYPVEVLQVALDDSFFFALGGITVHVGEDFEGNPESFPTHARGSLQLDHVLAIES